MGKLDELSRQVPTTVKGLAAVVVAWGAMLGPVELFPRLITALYYFSCARGWIHGPVASAMRDLVYESNTLLGLTVLPLAVGLTLSVPLALLVRMVARARVRAGLPDPLEGARQWTSAHPTATRALTATPAAASLATMAVFSVRFAQNWGAYPMYGHLTDSDLVRHAHDVHAAWIAGLTCVVVASAPLVYKATRAALAMFLSPTVDIREKDEAAAPTSERRVGFDAVAVTAESRAAVAAMALLPVMTFLGIQSGKLGDVATAAALTAYVTVAIAGALAFRRASRIAIGVDGIFVTGSSRSRFFAFRDLDAVRANGSDIEVVRKSRVVLRLQLHGEDATQKEAIVLRIEEAIGVAKQRKTAAVGEIVASSSEERLARLADGADGYRSPSVTRDQLWSVVRAPEPDRSTRTAAARALVKRGGTEDRERLRVAAGECAQPDVRDALMDLADAEDDADPEPTARADVRRASR